MTNREWMKTLTDEQLANFMTIGLCVRIKDYPNKISFCTDITSLGRRYTQTTLGVAAWLSEDQEFELVED